MSRWAVVLAGGVGSRFWPLSTPSRPKQLLPLVSNDPLLVDAVTRLRPLVPSEHILILTNDALVPAVSSLLPDLPRENLIAGGAHLIGMKKRKGSQRELRLLRQLNKIFARDVGVTFLPQLGALVVRPPESFGCAVRRDSAEIQIDAFEILVA